MAKVTKHNDPYAWLNKPDEYVLQSQAAFSNAPLIASSVTRQFLTTREIVGRLEKQQGLLLADDVGLGKTTVGVLAACAYASMQKRVRILAPNATVAEGWRSNLKKHLAVLQDWGVSAESMAEVKIAISQLRPGRVLVTTHGRYKQQPCDLLIVDEAHRSQGDGTESTKRAGAELTEGQSIKAAIRQAVRRNPDMRVLFLTATPFGIRLEELKGMLSVLNVPDTALDEVTRFSKALDRYWTGEIEASEIREAAREVITKRDVAIQAVQPYVIRHVIEDLDSSEQRAFGKVNVNITEAKTSQETVEVIARADRLFRVAKQHDDNVSAITNDPRNHVGWFTLKSRVLTLQGNLQEDPPASQEELKLLRSNIRRILELTLAPHPKAQHLYEQVEEILESKEKVLVFCHHHDTAIEVAHTLSKLQYPYREKPSFWQAGWESLLAGAIANKEQLRPLLNVYIKWLCTPLLVSQVLGWLPEPPLDMKAMVKLLKKTRARHSAAGSIASEALHLFRQLIGETSSSRAVLKAIAREREGAMLPDKRVMGLASISRQLPIQQIRDVSQGIIFEGKRPDLFMAIFNSPFGPDVLIATDRLSEGVNLHTFCRQLIHYELPYSPVRVIQRNGRLRRLGNWASKTKKNIEIYYPQLPQTRDEALVNIIRKRLDCFNMLLGGVCAPIKPDTVSQVTDIAERVAALQRAARVSDAVPLNVINHI